jgi:hypothetical protein
MKNSGLGWPPMCRLALLAQVAILDGSRYNPLPAAQQRFNTAFVGMAAQERRIYG